LKLAQALSKESPKIDPVKLLPLTAALANGRISVFLATPTGGAECKGMQTSTNVIALSLGQLTSAVAAEYAIVLVHTFAPYDCGTRLSETMNSAGMKAPGLKIVAPARRHLVSTNQRSAMRPALADLGISVLIRASLRGDGA
jgi:hypothetical protein